MNDKNANLKKNSLKKTTPEIILLIEKKLLFFHHLVQQLTKLSLSYLIDLVIILY